MRKIISITISILVMHIMLFSPKTNAAPSDYLILQSIGDYHSSGKGKCGQGAGFLEATDHFGDDHNDGTCRTGYYNTAQDLAISIQVTQHAGSDSDKWLLHEVEDAYRSDKTLNETTDTNVQIRTIDGNNIYFIGIYGGKSYTWVSNKESLIYSTCAL